MDNAKCFELAIILASPKVGELRSAMRKDTAQHDADAIATIEQFYRIVKAAAAKCV